MKADSSIEMHIDPKNYNETDLYIYQKIVRKLTYSLYSIKPDIAFVVGQLSRYNINLRKKHF